jgi:hypothetical protein
MSESHFLGLAQHINFTRLKELHLHWIQIGSESFKLFITTAKETLKNLTLNLVYLKEHISINPESTGWKHIWEFLGEELSLQSFYMANIGYVGYKVMIQGPGDSVEPTSSVRFRAEMSSISFSKWIRQLKTISTDRDSRVRRYPGLHPPKPQTSWKSVFNKQLLDMFMGLQRQFPRYGSCVRQTVRRPRSFRLSPKSAVPYHIGVFTPY